MTAPYNLHFSQNSGLIINEQTVACNLNVEGMSVECSTGMEWWNGIVEWPFSTLIDNLKGWKMWRDEGKHMGTQARRSQDA